MRIRGITLRPVALYSQPIWDISYGYRVFLVVWRVIEIGFTAARYMLIRAPLIAIWARLPVTKDINLPAR